MSTYFNRLTGTTLSGRYNFRPGKNGSARFNSEKGSWWISYNIGGKQVRESTKALTKSEATKIRNTKLSDFERGELRLPGKKGRALLIYTLADEYLDYAKANKS